LEQSGSGYKVLVTGADGFLGSNIVRELINLKYEVYGFIQKNRDAHTLEGLPVKLFRGDLCDSDDLLPLFRECDYIIHTAGHISLWPSRSKKSWIVNYMAVKRLVELARENNIRRFIHIGTANSFGYGPMDKPGNEEDPTAKWFGFDYIKSKYKAQEYIINEARTNGFPAVVINPTYMLGPYDSGQGSNRMILEICRSRVPGYSPGGRNYVHVKDVARAAVSALRLGRIGECYIVGNINLTYKDVFRTIAETLDVPAPSFPIPKLLAHFYGAIVGFLGYISGGKPRISYKIARLACTEFYYNQDKAVEELSLELTPIEDAIRESYLWFKEKGQVS
jgi:dihydroflavonol-4-reductase